MAGLLSYSVGGVGFLLIAALEALIPFPSPLSQTLNLPFLRHLSAALLSSLFISHSLLSSLLSSPPSFPLPLVSAASAAPFLLYSLSALLLPSLLSPLLPLLLLAAFSQELLLFSLRRKDLDGIENRYFDLLLVPILVCTLSTALIAARPRSPYPRLARAAGLALHGTWLIQMGFSFFSSAIAHGCYLHRRSWADYTVSCKGHPEYHRGRAIATLQFNCHLALMVVAAVGVYAVVVNAGGADGRRRGGGGYKELQTMSNEEIARFSLEDEEDEEGMQNGEVVVPVGAETRNGFGGSH